jgi:hypothetical protein
VVRIPPPFIVQLVEQPEVLQATTTRFDVTPNLTRVGTGAEKSWDPFQVDVRFSPDNDEAAFAVDAKGHCDIVSHSEDSDRAVARFARSPGQHVTPVDWTVDDSKLKRGVEKKLEISTRVRLSTWSFGAPFDTGTQIDPAMIDLVKQSGIDDLSLVNTVLIDERSVFTVPLYKHQPKATPRLRWATWTPYVANSSTWFAPASDASRCESYCKMLITAMHAASVQVQAGFCLGSSKNALDEADLFVKFLNETNDEQIDKLAQAFRRFCETTGFDGVGFDLEINGLGPPKDTRDTHAVALGDKRRDNLARLIQQTANELAKIDCFVSYANAPFAQDGVGMGGMQYQPYSLCVGTKNLIARPQCYAKFSDGLDAIVQGVECALRDPHDDQGGGLRPSQLQMAVHAFSFDSLCATGTQGVKPAPGEKDPAKLAAYVEESPNDKSAKTALGIQDTKSLCEKLLRPHRVGLMAYNLDIDAKGVLELCAHYDQILNGSRHPKRLGQPLQVPRSERELKAAPDTPAVGSIDNDPLPFWKSADSQAKLID